MGKRVGGCIVLLIVFLALCVLSFTGWSISWQRWYFVWHERLRSALVGWYPKMIQPTLRITAQSAALVGGAEKKVLLAYFGTLERSIDYTAKSHWKHVIKPLVDHGYSVDIAAFHLVPDSMVVNGESVAHKDFFDYVMPDFYASEQQSAVDERVRAYKTEHCKDERCGFKHAQATVANAFRQMYSERQLACMLANLSDSYQFGVVLGPDFYLLNHLDITAIERALESDESAVVVSDYYQEHQQAVSDGYYIAKPENLVKMLSMWDSFQILNSKSENLIYEEFVSKYSKSQNLKPVRMPLAYTKIRNNNGYDRMRYLQESYAASLNAALQTEILENFRAMVAEYPQLYYTRWRRN